RRFKLNVAVAFESPFVAEDGENLFYGAAHLEERPQERAKATHAHSLSLPEENSKQEDYSDEDTENHLGHNQTAHQIILDRYKTTPSDSQAGAIPHSSRAKSLGTPKPVYYDIPDSSADELDHRHRERHEQSVNSSDSEYSERSRRSRRKATREPRIRQIDLLAQDIERFDPDNKNINVNDYLREVDRCLVDLPNATTREKLRLIWKTSSSNVRAFIETLTPEVRDSYTRLRKYLKEEYEQYTDETSAMLCAMQIEQKRSESPREYYRRLRNAYFQGSSAPGLEEDRGFKSLFLHNLHSSVRNHVTVTCRQGYYSMREIRQLAQMTWETVVRPMDRLDDEPRVFSLQDAGNSLLDLEGSEAPPGRHTWRNPAPKPHHQSEWGRRQNRYRNNHGQNFSNNNNYNNRPRERGRKDQGGWKRDGYQQSNKRWWKQSERDPKHRGRHVRFCNSDELSELHSELESVKAQLAEIIDRFNRDQTPLKNE
uniref:Uncharacterized protein n=1 Tax=Cynoglossus semilaevis TaxID=244447 RepID=A0A3P8WGU8_CYNSE